MNVAPSILQPAVPDSQGKEEKLRGTVRDLEGVFVGQLFKAMRETVPEGGLTSGGTGEEMFTGLSDEHFARELPRQWHDGLSAALYNQLRSGLPK